ncbi:MAG TPA: aldolase [Candidatus Bathyarchaeia archaeon]|nr:aldolase [Candidatus Bathyarchaeia archaeon]
MSLSFATIKAPLDVPEEVRTEYARNFLDITRGSGRLMLFAGDQKIEHLNDDFYGPGISLDDNDPEHLFRIASGAEIGCLATQMGLIARYGEDYPSVNYLVKLNSKTNLVKTEQAEPISGAFYSVAQVDDFRQRSGLKVPAVGYTIYAGSEHEASMLHEAAQIIFEAHKRGIIAVIWIYPRGAAVKNEHDPHLIAGAAGLGCALGADFVKVNYPTREGVDSKEAFKEAVQAAGRCRVLCAGGSSLDVKLFLERLWDQIFVSGAAGNATGRNIHQKRLKEAIQMCNAISAIVISGATSNEALDVYTGRKAFKVKESSTR